jgi:Transcriptional regulator containing PAS, AAA-type ATPase, and DNA-binding domains
MEQNLFYEMILDNFTDAVYVLDDKGNYLFVNSAYVQMLNIPKSDLLTYNVHDFLESGVINFCIADIVYEEKRQVVMFQDIFDAVQHGRRYRLLVISTPVFNREGNVQNIIYVARPMNVQEQLQYEAGLSEAVAQFVSKGEVAAGGDAIVATSAAMREVLQLALTVSEVDSAVLISGESGTGKEVIANYIHQKSERSGKPMIIINCASLPANLLEAELFGYEKGAFTGALPGGKKGLFEEAEGGTILLDEINSMPLDLQGKLLRAIETKMIQRIGTTKVIRVDFRLLAATNEDLEGLVREKLFRADLYYRLNVIPIKLPPLRERREDIIPLANHFLYYFCKKHNKMKTYTMRTLEGLQQYDWPGNVRQLKNFVERSVVISIGEEIEIADIESVVGGDHIPSTIKMSHLSDLDYPQAFKPEFSSFEEGISLQDYLKQCERDYLLWALKKYDSTYRAAEALGTSQSLIMRRKKKHNI